VASYQASGVDLDWGDAPEPDFQFYRVYRDMDPQFVPSAQNLIEETATSSWTDSKPDPWDWHYKVTVVDHVGNEGTAAAPNVATAVADAPNPARFALRPAAPNPLNPSTTLSFELPARDHVRLSIYDVAGRWITTLLDEPRAAGRHELLWTGLDESRRLVASGTYLIRVESSLGIATGRVVLVK
jgi:hypothetical protein